MNKPVAVYKISNNINTKLYFGISSNPKHRWYTHKRRAVKNYKSAIYNAMCKYGVEAFKFDILYWCDSREEANEMEEFLISEYQTNVNGYNLQSGGGSFTHSLETRKKISAIQKGRVATAETRANMSAAQKGIKKSFRTQEHKDKLSAAGMDNKRTAESVEKTRQGNLGKKYPNRPPQSAETRAKRALAISETIRKKKEAGTYIVPNDLMSEASKQKRIVSMTGQKRSDETRAKLSANKKAYYQAQREAL